MHWNRIGVVGVAGLLAVGLQAKGKKPKSPPKDPQDEIAVASVIELKNHPVRRFIATPHYSRSYLYAEHADGSLTLIDVTDTAHPSVLAEVPTAGGGPAKAIVAVAGTAALVTDEGCSTQSALPVQTIRIVDFSDPRRPATKREFQGVTAITRDERRGLIFLANQQGIWILQQSLAVDPEVEKEYSRRVLYDH